MKSMEDLNLMSAPMLEKIHLDLTGNKPKKGLTKQQLVQRVFELQQPDPTPESDQDNTPPAENKPAAANDFDPLDGLLGDAPPADPVQGDADSLSVDDGAEDDLLGGDEPVAKPPLPAKWDAPTSLADAEPSQVKRALAHLPLRLEFDETGVTLNHGSKTLYATLKQPLHVIVTTAEIFAGVRR